MISDIPGIWLHHTSDCQKYFVLKAKPSLITDGLWSLSRNPNYLGELFILGAFAGLMIAVRTLPSGFSHNMSPLQVLPGITRCGGGPG